MLLWMLEISTWGSQHFSSFCTKTRSVVLEDVPGNNPMHWALRVFFFQKRKNTVAAVVNTETQAPLQLLANPEFHVAIASEEVKSTHNKPESHKCENSRYIECKTNSFCTCPTSPCISTNVGCIVFIYLPMLWRADIQTTVSLDSYLLGKKMTLANHDKSTLSSLWQ